MKISNLREQLRIEQRDHNRTRRKVQRLQFETQALRSIINKGYFNMAYSSRDCDGVYASAIYKFTSLEDYYKEEENTADWADGPFSFSYTDEEEEPLSSHGQGWDIN